MGNNMPTKREFYRNMEIKAEHGISAHHGFGSEHSDYIPSASEQLAQENKISFFDQQRIALKKRHNNKDLDNPAL